MAVGDIYVLKMNQELFTQAMLNVFYYEQTTKLGSDDAANLNEAFNAFILQEWQGCVGNGVTIPFIEAFAIANPSDFNQVTPAINTGLRTAPSDQRSPGWIAFSYRSNRNGAGTRSSYKRFGGIFDTDMNANVLDSLFLAIPSVGALQISLGNPVTSIAGDVYKPVQVKSGWQLGFPPIKNFDITSWFTASLSSQVSRKP